MKTARATTGNVFHCIRNVNFAADDDAYGKSIDENVDDNNSINVDDNDRTGNSMRNRNTIKARSLSMNTIILTIEIKTSVPVLSLETFQTYSKNDTEHA